MTDIKWPDGTVALLRARKDNVHYPEESFMTDFSVRGRQVRGSSDDGRRLCAYLEDWELIERPAEPWNGEGLPPVGTVCEFAGFNPEETLPSDPMIGDRVTVIAHFKSGSIDVAAFTFFAPPEFEYLQVAQGAYGCFRPIRTPEQIAAEERKRVEEEIESICVDGERNGVPFYKALYDAGYRKQAAE